MDVARLIKICRSSARLNDNVGNPAPIPPVPELNLDVVEEVV
jgi:hypothetical protein